MQESKYHALQTYNFNLWHHGLTSNLWLQAIVMALHALDDEEASFWTCSHF